MVRLVEGLAHAPAGLAPIAGVRALRDLCAPCWVSRGRARAGHRQRGMPGSRNSSRRITYDGTPDLMALCRARAITQRRIIGGCCGDASPSRGDARGARSHAARTRSRISTRSPPRSGPRRARTAAARSLRGAGGAGGGLGRDFHFAASRMRTARRQGPRKVVVGDHDAVLGSRRASRGCARRGRLMALPLPAGARAVAPGPARHLNLPPTRPARGRAKRAEAIPPSPGMRRRIEAGWGCR